MIKEYLNSANVSTSDSSLHTNDLVCKEECLDQKVEALMRDSSTNIYTNEDRTEVLEESSLSTDALIDSLMQEINSAPSTLANIKLESFEEVQTPLKIKVEET